MTTKTKKRVCDFLDACPGLWYGNTPNGYGKGNVTVETEKVAQAIDWLRKQRCTILETGPGPYEPAKSVFISFQAKVGACNWCGAKITADMVDGSCEKCRAVARGECPRHMAAVTVPQD